MRLQKWFCLSWMLVVAFGCQLAVAQPRTVQLETPAATLQTFQRNTDPLNSRPDIAAATMYAPAMSRKQRGQRALQLRQALDGLGLYLRPENAPGGNVPLPDTLESYTPFRSLPEVRLDKVGSGVWRFSEGTVNAIPRLHRRVFPFGRNGLLHDMPKDLRIEMLGLYRWQWIGLLILLLGGWAVQRLLELLTRAILGRILRRLHRQDLQAVLLRPTARRFSMLLVLITVSVLLPLLQLPPTLNRWLVVGLQVAGPLYVILLLYKVIDVVAEYASQRASGKDVNRALFPLVGAVVKIGVVVAGILVVLRVLDYDVTTVIAGLSIGGLALALAAQDTLKNFFASLMILLDKPFQIGDFVITGDGRGIVEEVGLRATRIRTFDNSLLYVPNHKLTDNVVENMGLRNYVRYLLEVGLALHTTSAQVEALCSHLRNWIESHPGTRKDFHQVFLHTLSDSAMVIRINLHMLPPTGNGENELRHAFNLFLLQTTQALGIDLAYPTQTLYLDRNRLAAPAGKLPPLPGSWPPAFPTQDHPEPPGFATQVPGMP